MSKFWAMLRDSYKEAVDGWIMFVMMVLIGLVVLFIACLSVEPVPAAEAVPRMLQASGGQGPFQLVGSDRGKGKKQALFLYQQSASDVQAGNGPDGRPWEAPVTFAITYTPTGGGAAGAEVELDEKGQPKADKVKKDQVFAGDPFREAVRYWATPAGGDKPKFTEELAEEFVAAQVHDTSRLNVTKVSKKATKQDGGLAGLFTAKPVTYEVTASGGDRLGWAHTPSLLFGAVDLGIQVPLGELVYTVESRLLNGVGAWVILLAGVVVTAGFIPNLLRKGGIDLMISKPISRPAILLYKYLGGLLFVLLLTTAAVGGVWLVIGLRTGVWAPGLWWCVPSITAYFAILYACSTLVGVLTRNTIVSIVLTVVFWFMIWLLGFLLTMVTAFETLQRVQTQAQGQRAAQQNKQAPAADAPIEVGAPDAADKSWFLRGLETTNRLSPRVNDLDDLTTRVIARGLLGNADRREAASSRGGLQWAEVAAVSVVWLALFLGLATLRFVTRSY